jgi:hypothetical protein
VIDVDELSRPRNMRVAGFVIHANVQSYMRSSS